MPARNSSVRYGYVAQTLHWVVVALLTVQVTIGTETIRGVDRFYAQHPPGAVMTLVGSSGRLEIAVNGGNAATRLGAGVGEPVRVEPGPMP